MNIGKLCEHAVKNEKGICGLNIKQVYSTADISKKKVASVDDDQNLIIYFVFSINLSLYTVLNLVWLNILMMFFLCQLEN